MRYGVVEGEPGIFPAPVAKVMRTIGGLFSRKKPGSESGPTADPGPTAPPPEDTPLSDLDPKPPAAASGDGEGEPAGS